MVCDLLENENNSQSVNIQKNNRSFYGWLFFELNGVILRYERYAKDSYKKKI